MRPVLARLVAQGVEEEVFHDMDTVVTAEMLLHLGGASHGVVARALRAETEPQKEEAAAALEGMLRLHGIAIDRILGLRERSGRMLSPGYVRTLMAPRPAPATSRLS